MNVPQLGGALALWIGGCLLAQTAPIVPILTGSPIQRAIPPGLGGGSIREVTAFDPEADLLRDLAIRWSNGDVTLCHAPEVLSSFAAAPVQGIDDLARLPAAAAAANGLGARDALLVADGTALFALVYDPDAYGSPTNPTGFVATPVASTAAWQQVVRIEVRHAEGICWLLGLAADRITVHIGMLQGGAVTAVGIAVAGDVVQDTLLLERGDDGLPMVAVRTNTGLELRSPGGYLLCPPIAAPTHGALGTMCSLEAGGGQQLAWVAQDGSDWRLRVYAGTLQQQDEPMVIAGPTPTRFHPITLGAIPLTGSDDDGLVLHHDTSTTQTVFVREAGGHYAMAGALTFPGVTYGVDGGRAAFADFDHDDEIDLAAALDSQRVVQIARIPNPLIAEAGGPSGSTIAIDLLPTDCLFTSSHLQGGTGTNDIVRLLVGIPGDLPVALEDLEVHVVAWPQVVHCPTGACGGTGDPFDYEPPGVPVANAVFDLKDPVTGQYLTTPIFDLQLPEPPGGDWSPEQHHYFMLRLIQRSQSGALVWSSPAQMVGLLAGTSLPPPVHAFMNSISVPTAHPVIQVGGGENRNVGVIHKPIRIDPPPSSVKPPPPPAAAGSPSGSW
ncbi:MAG: hypothetical protein AB7O97_07520 [Planctomycetota bacterium]